MSSSEALSDLIQELQIMNVYYYIDIAIFVVVAYDWLLTFPDEVRIMWKRPLTGAKLLFFLNRYLAIANYADGIINDHISETNSSCLGLGISDSVFSVLHNLVVSVFQILRIYTISGRRKRYVLLIGIFLVFANFYSIYVSAASRFASSGPPVPGCIVLIYMSEITYNSLFIVQRVCLIVADAILVLVTIHHTYGTVKASRKANIRSTFSSTILNEGILYFSVMLVMNTVDLIVDRTTNNSYFDGFAAFFDYLMISHFLLNLQEISTITINGSNLSRTSFIRSTREQMSSIHFADMVIGNLGESLRDESSDDQEYDDEGEDSISRVGDIEMCPPPHSDEEDPVDARLATSEDIYEENAAGPSRLADALRNRSTSTGMSTEAEMSM